MMSKCIHRNQKFLKTLLKAKGARREAILEKATKDEIRCLTEIAYNVVKGHFILQPHTLRSLEKHKEEVRKLSKRRSSHKKKKFFLKQKGGFLPLIISPV